MSQILELRNRRATISARVTELAKIEEGGAELSAEQLTELAALDKEFAEAGAKLARLEAAQRMAMEAAQQVDTLNPPLPGSARVPAQARSDIEFRPHALGRLVATLNDFSGMPLAMVTGEAAERYGEDIAAVLANNTASGGNVLIPQNLGQQIIEMLMPRAVVRQMGAVTIPLPNGNLTLGRNKEGVVGGYVTQTGDNDTDRISVDSPKYDDIELKTRTYAGLIPINNDFLRNANHPSMLNMIQNDAVRGIAGHEDGQFIRGDDLGGKAPRSMRSWVLPQQTFKMTPIPANATLPERIEIVRRDIGRMVLALETASSEMIKPGFLMAPRIKRFLMSLVDGNGNKVFPEMKDGMLEGYRFLDTTRIPTNLGATGNQSELYFADFADLYIGEDGAYEMAISTESAYQDENGKWVSAFQTNRTLLRIIQRHDFAPRHQENIAVTTEITWGA